MEYEEHLRNTLEKGMDAESYSLHTFEALLTQSMENLGEQRSLDIVHILGECSSEHVQNKTINEERSKSDA